SLADLRDRDHALLGRVGSLDRAPGEARVPGDARLRGLVAHDDSVRGRGPADHRMEARDGPALDRAGMRGRTARRGRPARPLRNTAPRPRLPALSARAT